MLAFVTLFLAITTALVGAYSVPRCFDCNYAPSGYGAKKSYNDIGYNAGAPQCALRHYADRNALDKWKCKSGKCFVRLDKNGLVYRGCADENNLPSNVEPHRQCEYQAGSLWYFCKGDFCNDKQIGKTCGYKPAYGKGYGNDVCDGKCYGNPSGLFPDKYNKNGFIQCGCGNDNYGNTCTCCVPFHFKCPYGTRFDAYLKTCVGKDNKY